MNALRLRVLKSGEEVQSLDLNDASQEIAFGRAPGSDVRLNDRAVGRQHAVLSLGKLGASLQKKTKFGKLQVNGVDVFESPLKVGDVISIADYLVKVEALAKAESEPSTGSEDLGEPAPAPAEAESGEKTGVALSAESPQEMSAPEAAEPAALPPMPEQDLALDDQVQSLDVPPLEGVQENDKTSMVSTSAVDVRLVFKPGDANTTEVVLNKPLITLGRGSDCDVVLADQKASRKHAAIERQGLQLALKDLESGNGTFVNDERITSRDIGDGDRIRIGDTEFSVSAVSGDYKAQEANGGFLEVPEDLPPDLASPVAAVPTADPALATLDPSLNAAPSAPPAKPTSLLEKFKALPRRKKIFYVVGIALVAILGFELLDEQESAQKAMAKKRADAARARNPNEAAFMQLPKEKQDFIRNTYDLALEHFTKKNYEQALYEINKIHEIAPGFSYKDSKDIEIYAKKGIEMVKALQEEQKRKEEEDARQKKIADYIEQAQKLLDANKEVEAREIFNKVMELDPDNPAIAKMKATLEEKEHQKRLADEQRKQLEQMRRLMSDAIEQGQGLATQRKFYEAIDKFGEVSGLGSDEELLKKAKELSAKAKQDLIDLRDPHVKAAQQAFESQELEKSRNEWIEALVIDPKCNDCREGLARIKHSVHESAQKIFIDAIIAESVSDLSLAKQKYLECYQASVPEDEYYGRCWRRYHRFVTIESRNEEGSGEPGEGLDKPVRAPAGSHKTMDPHTEEVLETL